VARDDAEEEDVARLVARLDGTLSLLVSKTSKVVLEDMFETGSQINAGDS
jgi:hypothetical protein